MKRGVKKTKAGGIRIISGKWRGRKLPVLDAEGLRPTTDRTKETLFNWLMQDVQDSHCLDAFAGSGGLGLEALSRYARSVRFCELNTHTARQLISNLKTLNVDNDTAQVTIGDSIQLLANCAQRFDLIFLDPPFYKGLIDQAIQKISSNDLLSENGLVYIESEAEDQIYNAPKTWHCIKQKRTQQVDYRLFRNITYA